MRFSWGVLLSTLPLAFLLDNGVGPLTARAEPFVSRLTAPGMSPRPGGAVQLPTPTIRESGGTEAPFEPYGELDNRRLREEAVRPETANAERGEPGAARLLSLLVIYSIYPRMTPTLPPPPPPPRALLDPPKFVAPLMRITLSPPTVSHAPEPSSIVPAVLGAAFGGVYLLRRRRRALGTGCLEPAFG